MINGSVEVNVLGVTFPETIKYFQDSKKITFIIKSKGLNYRVTEIYCEYYGSDAPVLHEKMHHSQVFAKVTGTLTNHTRSGNLMMLVDKILAIGVHDNNTISRDDLDKHKINKVLAQENIESCKQEGVLYD